MAHTLILTRGELNNMNRFFGELASRYLPFKKYNHKTKKLDQMNLQVRVSPVRLYDVSYPKEYRDIVHNTIFQGNDGSPQVKGLGKFFAMLRKVLGFNKMAEYKKDKKMAMFPPEHLEIIGIGVKDDYWIEPDGTHVLEKDKSNLAWEGI